MPASRLNAASLVAAALAATAAHPEQTQPNVMLIVADDYGWNDVGFHQNKTSSANPAGGATTNDAIRTPNLDRLAKEGVRLENYYVQPVCSPTRGAIQTGRYPSHTGVGPGVIPPSAPYGMGGGETFVSQLLKAAGYATHAIGKWHLGFCDERFTPTFRGYDSFFGYLNGAEDYWTHYRCQAEVQQPDGERTDDGAGPVSPDPGGIVCSGRRRLDGNDGAGGAGKWNNLDFRNGTEANVLAPATNTSFEDYSAFVFGAEAARIAAHHAASKPGAPLFLYLPFQSVHEPLQAPLDLIESYAGSIADADRRTTAAMVTAMDTGIGAAVGGWAEAGVWEHTVLIFSTDNGGPLPTHNNYPLRGGKFTTWEVPPSCVGIHDAEHLCIMQDSVEPAGLI